MRWLPVAISRRQLGWALDHQAGGWPTSTSGWQPRNGCGHRRAEGRRDECLRTMERDKTLDCAPYLHKTVQPLAEAVESYNSVGPLFEDQDEHGEECEGVYFV